MINPNVVCLVPDCFASNSCKIRAKKGMRIFNIVSCDWTAAKIVAAYQVLQILYLYGRSRSTDAFRDIKVFCNYFWCINLTSATPYVIISHLVGLCGCKANIAHICNTSRLCLPWRPRSIRHHYHTCYGSQDALGQSH